MNKNLSLSLLALTVSALAVPAYAAPALMEFELDENYAQLAPEAGEPALDPTESDHNIDTLHDGSTLIIDENGITPIPQGSVPQASSIVLPQPVAEQPPAPVVTPVPQAPVAKPAPTVSQILKEKQQPTEIPLIMTDSDAQVAPGVTYITGGIGDEEKQALEAAKPDYNVYVMSASSNGAFVGQAQVVIRQAAGDKEQMLSVTAGPLLYVKLPEGKYTLDATLGAQAKHQALTIGKDGKPVRAHLGWAVPATLGQ